MAKLILPGPTEQQFQKALVREIRLRNPDLLFWHTPNGGRRGAIEGKNFKDMGTLAGVSDLLFLDNGEFFALELKRRGEKPSKKQELFMDRVRRAGFEAIWVEDHDEAIAVLGSWGIIPNA